MNHKQPTIPRPAWSLQTRNASLIMPELNKCRRRRHEAIEQTMKGFVEGTEGFDEGTKGFDKSAKSLGKGEKGSREKGDTYPRQE